MKPNRKQTIAVAAIVLCGAVLAALILRPAANPTEAQQAAHGEQDAHQDKPAAHGHGGNDRQGGREAGAGPGGNAAAAASGGAGGGGNAGAGHGEPPAQIALTEAQVRAAGIVLAAAGPGSIATSTTLPGEIRYDGDRTAHVVPRMAGLAEKVYAELGQSVKKGQVLAVISSSDLSERRSELLSAQQRQALARALLAREKKLWEERISAEQDYLQAQQQASEADIAVRNAQQKLAALGAGALPSSGPLNRYEVRAPFDGMVLEKHVASGESVKEDANIFTLSDLSSVWAEFAVTAVKLDAVRVGQQATVQAVTGSANGGGNNGSGNGGNNATSATGTVAYVGALLGEQTRAATARIRLKNPDMAWRPGLFVNVSVAAQGDAGPVAVAVPAGAVQTVEGQPSVFVRTASGFAVQALTLGRSDGRLVEVLSGLKPGTQVAAEGSFVLKAELGKSGNEHAH